MPFEPQSTRRPLLLALGGLAVAGLAACGERAAPAGEAAVGGPFRLVNQDGRAVDQTLLLGKWSVVFFGFTFCPDICPATLATLGQAMGLLGPRAKDVQVVFVSVDPERDTPAQLKTYLSSPAFPRNAVGLTGSPDQVAAAAKAYKAYYQKSGTGADYSVDHSAYAYLMNPKGRYDRLLAQNLTPEEIARQISDAMRRG
ncbi:SCO family protein [Caulobacter sp. CCUG 60055]|nr:SCO family protein [Caulobacter sp. CCUG 60055]